MLLLIIPVILLAESIHINHVIFIAGFTSISPVIFIAEFTLNPLGYLIKLE